VELFQRPGAHGRSRWGTWSSRSPALAPSAAGLPDPPLPQPRTHPLRACRDISPHAASPDRWHPGPNPCPQTDPLMRAGPRGSIFTQSKSTPAAGPWPTLGCSFAHRHRRSASWRRSPSLSGPLCDGSASAADALTHTRLTMPPTIGWHRPSIPPRNHEAP
jgi:hypothetical protein